jgi:phage terminase large subunit-like protein
MTMEMSVEEWQRFRDATREEQVAILADMSPIDLLKLDAQFALWAARGQMEPPGEWWTTWLMMAGRGFGKTRAGSEWVLGLARMREQRIALVGATLDEGREVMVEGPSGILTLARKRRLKVKWEAARGLLTFPSGSIAQVYSAESPEKLRGFEHHFAWADELAKWRRAEATWRNLEMGMRCGDNPRTLVTTTPRPMPLIEELRRRNSTVETNGRTSENVTLSQRFVELMIATYGGTRWGRQELDGEYFNEAEASLFPRALLERARTLRDGPSTGSVPPQEERDLFERIVVGVDPPVSDSGDACGIVVAGRRDGVIHVLADLSMPASQPARWAARVAETARLWGASHVVAEANQGGLMVGDVLRAADAGLRVKLVYASAGKCARAEPVAVRMENGRLKLAGVFPELESELAGLMVGGRYDGGRSPDRADAMVWAVTELSELRSGLPRVRAL